MDTREFFDLILPTTGLRCVAVAGRKKGLGHFFADTSEQAAARVADLEARSRTVYHGCATYKTRESRLQTNVAAVRSFWMDIDVGEGKPYAKFSVAAKAVIDFSAAVGIAHPYIVKSGTGVHAYWPCDADMDPGEWKLAAQLLKEAGKRYGLGQDPSRTADCASVLRPVGTTHRKGEPRPVVMAMKGETTTLEAFQTALAGWLGESVPEAPAGGLDALGAPPASLGFTCTNSDLSAGMEYPPTFAAKIADKCGVVGLMRDTKGNIDQPTWYSVLGVMAFCEDGEALAHEWSNGHPQYTKGETDTKLAQAGRFKPTTCSKLSDSQPAICAACPLRGEINSPVALGVEIPPAAIAATRLSDDIELHRLSSLQGQPLYKLRPVHDGLAYRGEVTLLVARGGQAKSTYAIAASLAIATGLPLLGMEPGPPGTILMVNAEDSQGWLRTQFHAACARHGVGAPTNIFIYGQKDAEQLAFTEMNHATRREQVSQAGINALRELVKRLAARFIALDPWAALIPYGANDNGLMAAVMKALKRIAADLDVAILVIAHTRKGGDMDVDGAEITSGAAAITNLSRAVWSVRTPDAKTCRDIGVPLGQERAVRELVPLKANRRSLAGSAYFMIESVTVNNGTAEYPHPDEIGVAVPFTPSPGGRQIPQQVLLDALGVLAVGRGGVPFSPAAQAGSRFYGDALAQALAPYFPKADAAELKRQAKVVYGDLEARGWVEVIETSIGRNTRKAVHVRWDATPWGVAPQTEPQHA